MGNITYLEGLAHSSNVAFVHVIQKIGVEKWKQYLKHLDLVNLLIQDLQMKYLVPNPFNSYLQQLSTGFGQGIAIYGVSNDASFYCDC